MIRTAPVSERTLAAVAMLAAAESIVPPGTGPRDPRERIAWAESGAPFLDAGIAGLRDGVEPAAQPVPPAHAAWVAQQAIRAAREPHLLGQRRVALAPRAARHAGGQFYTPAWLAEQVIRGAGYPARRDATLLDPMCGSGVFLTAALRRHAAVFPDLTARELAARVHGMEVDPLAVLLSRCGVLVTLVSLRGPLGSAHGLPHGLGVRRADALLEDRADDVTHDVIAGNPPWVAWDNLPDSWRQRTQELWKRHGLFPEDGRRRDMQAVLGSGKKDLAMLATYVAAQRWLAPGGVLSFVLTRSVLKSVASGAGFRRFTLADGTPLGVREVLDPGTGIFPGVAARPIVLTLRKGEPTRYPVPWRRGAETLAAEPVDPDQPGSAWITAPAERLPALRRLLGRSPYRARTGAYTGGANGVYWMRPAGEDAARGVPSGCVAMTNLASAGKRVVPQLTVEIEAALLYPLLRASDVRRFHAHPSAWILMAQDPQRRQGIDEAVMRARHPAAWDYLRRMEDVLSARRDRGTRALIRCGAPPWTMFSVSAETMAAWKVVWPRIATRVRAAVAGPVEGLPVIPQETCTFIACEGEVEASYLAGLLNGSRFHEAASSFADTGGKSFGAPHLLRHIAVPRYRGDEPAHRELASRVMRARLGGTAVPGPELDDLADAVWERVISRSAATR